MTKLKFAALELQWITGYVLCSYVDDKKIYPLVIVTDDEKNLDQGRFRNFEHKEFPFITILETPTYILLPLDWIGNNINDKWSLCGEVDTYSNYKYWLSFENEDEKTLFDLVFP